MCGDFDHCQYEKRLSEEINRFEKKVVTFRSPQPENM
jgi:hypothetical protein